jgi:sulfite reductase (ferredoxin)
MVPAERWALACPALPTCGLALTEAERVRDLMIAEIVERMARWGVERERVSIRITGCPNGCARPYSGDIGIVGRIPGFYSIYVGGDFEGTRLNEVVAERIRLAEVADVLDPLFAAYAAGREPGEGFGDFCHRVGVAKLHDVAAQSRGKIKDAAD